MVVEKKVFVHLYRNLIRTSKQFPYSFKEFSLRRIRDAYREGRSETDPVKIQKNLEKAQETLQLIQRQTIINKMYTKGNLVVEVCNVTQEQL